MISLFLWEEGILNKVPLAWPLSKPVLRMSLEESEDLVAWTDMRAWT